jgi:integrase/recombinase XerD
MREKGLKETGANAAIRAINSYLYWNSGSDRKCGAGCTHPRISQLKEPQNIMPTLSEAQVKLIVGWKPGKNFPSEAAPSSSTVVAGLRLSNFRGARIAGP